MEQRIATKHQPAYRSIRDIATTYGGSEAFWRKLVFLRAIPFVKLGSSVKLAVEDVESYITSCKVPARAGEHLRRRAK